MGLNVNNAPKGGKDFPVLEAGSYPARVVQVIDLGLQPQEFEGDVKAPANEVWITYELSDEFLPDEDGKPMEDKPRWFSEWFPIRHISSDKAKSTKRISGIDPKGLSGGDFTKVLTFPCMVTLNVGERKKDKKPTNGISSVSAMREKDAAKLPDLVNKTKLFTLDQPDLEVFKSLPEFLQQKITSNLEFAGSKLEKLLGGNPQPVEQKKGFEPGAEGSPF